MALGSSAMSRKANRRSGFTLIELLIVVAILGILSSIAVPYFFQIKLKSKRAERLAMLRSIEKTVFQYMDQKEALVTACGSGCTCVTAPLNPTGTLDGSKRQFNPNTGDWPLLGFAPDGWLYYEYSVSGQWCPTAGTGSINFQARGDLDADGTINFLDQTYTLSNNMWQLTLDQESGDLY
jgi:type IV pilus assembly protein PilA